MRVNTIKRKSRIITSVPAVRVKAGRFYGVIKESKAVNASTASQTLSIRTVCTIAPIIMRAVKFSSIMTGVKQNWKIRRSQSCWWRFVDVDYFLPTNVHTHTHTHTHTHNHTVSDVGGYQFKSVYFSRSRTNVARLSKLVSISFTAQTCSESPVVG